MQATKVNRNPRCARTRIGMPVAATLFVVIAMPAAASPLPGVVRQPWVGTTDAEIKYDVVRHETGFDVVYRIANRTAEVIELPTLEIGGIELGPQVEWLDTASGSVFTSAADQPDACREYPTDAYAPVAVVRDGTHAVGLSVQYPVEEYEHPVTSCFRQPVTGSLWFYMVPLHGSIMPGESQTYTISARTAGSDDWLETLEPYKRYFDRHYGDRAQLTRHGDEAAEQAGAVAGHDIEHLSAPLRIADGTATQPHQLAEYLVPGGEIRVTIPVEQLSPGRVSELTAWGMVVHIE